MLGGLNVVSWLPVDLTVVPSIWALGFPVVFVVMGLTILAYSRDRTSLNQSSLRNIISFLPRWLRIVALAAFLYAGGTLAGVIISGALPGNPEQLGHRYFFSDHGHLIPTSRAGYVRGVSLVTRMFSGIEVVFLGFSYLALTYAPPARKRQSPQPSSPQDSSAKPLSR